MVEAIHQAVAGGQWGNAEDDLPINELVERLHDGRLRSDALSIEQRQQCVGYLTLEGFSAADIQQVLRISERTVQRDRAAFRRDHAVQPDMTLGDELLGEFQAITINSIQRLIRLCRDTQAAPYARLWAEEAIVRNYQRLIDTTHRLRYFADGKARLEHLLAKDPAEQQRRREQMEANLKTAEMLLGRTPGTMEARNPGTGDQNRRL